MKIASDLVTCITLLALRPPSPPESVLGIQITHFSTTMIKGKEVRCNIDLKGGAGLETFRWDISNEVLSPPFVVCYTMIQ